MDNKTINFSAKLFSFVIVFISVFIFGQNEKRAVQGLYFSPELSVGLNLSNIMESKRESNSTSENQYKTYPNDFSYGVSAVAGINFIPNLSLGGGIKYTYTTDNFHILYGIIQPKILFNVQDGEPVFIDLTYGFQVNRSAAEHSDFYGIKLGTLVSHSKRLSHQGGLYLEGQQLGNTGATFVGVFYGMTLFSNKNYNEYGKDQNK